MGRGRRVNRLRYLVTGCPRSGTVFMARLLTSVGVPCGHEAVFDYRGLDAARGRLAGREPVESSWVSRARRDGGRWSELPPWLPDASAAEAESSYMAAPYLGDTLLDGVRVIHVVRDPVRVVQSLCHSVGYFLPEGPKDLYEDFILRSLPELRTPMPQYDRACLFWVRWNQTVERRGCDYRHRAEDAPDGLLAFLGRSGPCFADRTINTFGQPAGPRFSADQIRSRAVAEEFAALGRSYGYSVRSNQLLL